VAFLQLLQKKAAIVNDDSRFFAQQCLSRINGFTVETI
jgi:hypothetical protein